MTGPSGPQHLARVGGSGKTTLANYIAARLRQVGRNVEVLDEDELGEHLWKEFDSDTKEERLAIARRLGFLAEMLTRNNACTLVACESPYKSVRDENRRRIERYIEVYVDCPTDELIKRDTTGKYKKALANELPNFIGITEPYEPPPAGSPEVKIQTDQESVEAGGLKIFQALLDLGHVTAEDLKVITGTRMKANPVKPKRGGGSSGKRAGAGPRAAARVVRAAKPKPAKRKR